MSRFWMRKLAAASPSLPCTGGDTRAVRKGSRRRSACRRRGAGRAAPRRRIRPSRARSRPASRVDAGREVDAGQFGGEQRVQRLDRRGHDVLPSFATPCRDCLSAAYAAPRLPHNSRDASRALRQRAQLRPHDALVYALGERALREAAIGAGHDILAADELSQSHQPLRHQFRMLDDVGGMADAARDQRLALGQLHALPHRPFVLVARIGRLVCSRRSLLSASGRRCPSSARRRRAGRSSCPSTNDSASAPPECRAVRD